jgi:hypothetical protein
MKPIATDTYHFEGLITRGYTYVDKTEVLYPLINDSIGSQFFLSRPRRFGKSLLISTFKSLFQGRRDLFKGLAIDSLVYDWKSYPVLHLDMGSMQAPTLAEFDEKLLNQLMSLSKELDVEVERSSIPSIVFTRLCEALADKSPHKQFVMLVDEYDKPLLGKLNTPEVVQFRDALKSFYSVIKTKESLMRFTFITGISKFSKVSIFSDLNNLIDISMSAQFATLLGYTHDEVKRFFPDWIEKLAKTLGVSNDEAFAELVRWYDGYRFEENSEPVINPVSLGLCLRDSKFKTYWSSTAVPTFLVDLLKNRPLNLQLVGIDESMLDAYEPTALNPITLLYQTGYLTISGFRQRGHQRTYSLDFPNMEVRNSFNTSLARGYVNIDENHLGSLQNRCIDALYDNELDVFFDTLKIFFANIPYDLSSHAPEETYQAVFCAILYFIGVGVTPEVRTNEGRIDAVMETTDTVYVMEFKRDKSAAEALSQIKEKKYYEKFLASGKKITLVGVNFDSQKRTISEYLIEGVNGDAIGLDR